MYTCEKTPYRYLLYPMTVCRLESLLRPPEHPGLHSIRRYRGPSPGVRVLPWVFRSLPREVLKTINSCEKTACRYLLSLPSFGTAWPSGIPWTSEYVSSSGTLTWSPGAPPGGPESPDL